MRDAKLKINVAVAIELLAAFIIRIVYILNTSVYERGHDVGAYTSLLDGQINPGHLGYIEYIVKFGTLPKINPFSLFSYYHPPLHHLLAAIVVKISLLSGASYEIAFENIQLLVCFYGMLSIMLIYLILKELFGLNPMILVALLLVSFHPTFIYMSAYINNDMLTFLFEVLCIYFTVLYIKDRRLKYLILMALSIGLGMCVKISVIMMAIPIGIVLLYYLVMDIKAKNYLKTIGEYLIFGIISISTGLSWTIRNLIMFSQKPGIASATSEDIKYMGNTPLIQRLMMPTNWGMEYPFFSEYGKDSTNVWLIMFRTAIFGEMRPDLSEAGLFLARLAFIVSTALGLMLSVIFIIKCICYIKEKTNQTLIYVFLLTGFATIVFSYIAFVIKYPYTCSCDFRYINIILVYLSIAIMMIKGYGKED